LVRASNPVGLFPWSSAELGPQTSKSTLIKLKKQTKRLYVGKRIKVRVSESSLQTRSWSQMLHFDVKIAIFIVRIDENFYDFLALFGSRGVEERRICSRLFSYDLLTFDC